MFDSPAKKSTKVVTMQKLMEQIWKMMSIPTFALIIVQVTHYKCPMMPPCMHKVPLCTRQAQSMIHHIAPDNSQLQWCLQSPENLLNVAQGIVGSIPWTALVFFTLYLQLLGMTDFAASVLMSLFLGSTGPHILLLQSFCLICMSLRILVTRS